ncbi:MAG: nucleotidyltransferase family protein [Ignisphaera sp.]|nr:nucleotidyltransferase family protein [Ignisphaera sp.]
MLQYGVVAAILAGGEGSRFKPYTDIVPKPMIPIGSEEKPILEHIICWLRRFGVRDIILLVGYKWKQIRNYFGDGSRHGVRIRYSVDDAEYRGTGGALLRAYKNGLLPRQSTVIVWYGDILAAVDVEDLLNLHWKSQAHAVIVVANRYQVPVGVANVDSDGNVIGLVEKPWLNIYATIGVLTLETSVFQDAENALGKSFDIMGDLMPWMIKAGYKVKAYIFADPWYDVGSLERYVKIEYDKIRQFLCEEHEHL